MLAPLAFYGHNILRVEPKKKSIDQSSLFLGKLLTLGKVSSSKAFSVEISSPMGHHFVASIGDTTPPNADFDRLLYIGERMAKEGRLPLAAGDYGPALSKTSGAQMVAPGEGARTAPGIGGDSPYAQVLQDVLDGDHRAIVEHAQGLLGRGFKAKEILHVGMLPAMEVIGAKFTNGTVRGDLHDIGKNMVFTMLKSVGFDVVDLGVNVKVDVFVQRVAREKPDVLGLSALLTTTMPQIRDVIDALSEAGLRDKVKVLIGGAPVNQKFADDVGADGYGADAGAAVGLAKELLSIS